MLIRHNKGWGRYKSRFQGRNKSLFRGRNKSLFRGRKKSLLRDRNKSLFRGYVNAIYLPANRIFKWGKIGIQFDPDRRQIGFYFGPKLDVISAPYRRKIGFYFGATLYIAKEWTPMHSVKVSRRGNSLSEDFGSATKIASIKKTLRSALGNVGRAFSANLKLSS